MKREAERRLPFAAVAREARKALEHKSCLHPQSSSKLCDQIVSAHTVQRAGILEQIVDSSRHVLGFDPMSREPNGQLAMQRIGWRNASTFTGFCAKHDTSTFAPLETKPFSGSPEQCFLLAYRALCHEVYQKRASLRAQPVLRSLGDRGMPVGVQVQFQHDYDVIEAGTRRGLGYFERLKRAMDSELMASDYSGWERTVIRFRGQICVATCGVVSPNRDLVGNTLQVLHDKSKPDQEPLFCNVVSIQNGGAVVFSWIRGHKAPRLFVESVCSSPTYPTRTSRPPGGSRFRKNISDMCRRSPASRTHTTLPYRTSIWRSRGRLRRSSVLPNCGLKLTKTSLSLGFRNLNLIR